MDVKATLIGNTMAMIMLDTTVIVAVGIDSIAYNEWSDCFDLIQASIAGVDDCRFLVLSDGASPDLLQRRQMEQQQRTRGVTGDLTAMVSDDPGAHSVAQVIRWFNPLIRAFGTTQMTEALDYLGISLVDRPEVLAAAAKLQAHLRGEAPLSDPSP